MFEYLDDLELGADKAADFQLLGIPGFEGRVPSLKVRPATNANKDLVNGVLKKTGKVRALASKGQDADFLEATRNEDRELYADFIVLGWTDIVNSKKELVPYSKDAAKELMRKLPIHTFDRLRAFASTPESFLNPGEMLDAGEGTLGN